MRMTILIKKIKFLINTYLFTTTAVALFSILDISKSENKTLPATKTNAIKSTKRLIFFMVG